VVPLSFLMPLSVAKSFCVRSPRSNCTRQAIRVQNSWNSFRIAPIAEQMRRRTNGSSSSFHRLEREAKRVS
jgi:hypothetical protein